MYQLGNHHFLREGMATVLALVGLLLLAAVRVIGLLECRGMNLLQCIGTAFRAGAVVRVMFSLVLQHEGMSVGTTIGLEAQSPNAVLHEMGLGQLETGVFFHLGATGRALTLIAFQYPILKLLAIVPSQPWCHPESDFVGFMVGRGLINLQGVHRLFGQGVGDL